MKDEMNPDVLALAFRQTLDNSRDLLVLGFTQFFDARRDLLAWSLTQFTDARRDVLAWSFGQQPYVKRRHFKGKQTFAGSSDYDLRVNIGGFRVSECELVETLSIVGAENEAMTAKIVLRKPRERQHPKAINVHQWHNRRVMIDLVDHSGSLRLFSGVVQDVDGDLQKGRFELRCTDRREDKINALPRSVIERIGITSTALHGEQFNNQYEALSRRLETVPASFEFDAWGNGHLTMWQSKAIPDYVISPCVIYERGVSVKLASVDGVLNTVDVNLSFSYSSLRERSLHYDYVLGIDVCRYAAYQRLSSLDAIAEAVAQTSWALGGFQFERAAKSGYYRCYGGKRIIHRRDYVKAEFNDSGRYSSIRRVMNTDVVAGHVEMFKRWQQTIREHFTLTISNSHSISRYGKTTDSVHASVAADSDVKWEAKSRHENKLKYEITTDDRFFADFQTKPYYQKYALLPTGQGDWFLDLDGNGGNLQAAWNVAYATAVTKIWAAHRQNRIELHMKLMPHISVRQTHLIQHSHIQAKVKVARFEHQFDFRQRLGSTTVSYAVFQNGGSGGAWASIGSAGTAPRVNRQFAKFQQNLVLRRHEILPDQSVDGLGGMVYQYGAISRNVQLYQPVVFQIPTPEIERESTETIEATATKKIEVAVPNDWLVTKI